MFLVHITNPKSFVFNFWGSLQSWQLFRDPAGAQTQNLQNRNLTLYSIELRGRASKTLYLLLPIKRAM